MALTVAVTSAQTKRTSETAKPKKKLPASIQTATTKDGRTVLLKSDGTWEFTADPVIPATEEHPQKQEPPKRAEETALTEAPPSTLNIAQPKDTEIVGLWDMTLIGPTGQTLPATLRVDLTSTEAAFTATLDFGPKQIQSSLSISNRKFVTSFVEGAETIIFEGELEPSGLRGTFSMTGPQGGQSKFTASRRVSGTQVGTGVGVLTVQAGIVYKMGGPQPVARTTFHLLRKDLNDILSAAGLRAEKNKDLLTTYAFAVRFQGSNRTYATFYQIATTAIKAHIVATTVTDFNGIGQFPPVPSGSYYVIGHTETRRGFALWNTSVGVTTGQTAIVLDQNNAAIAL